MKYDILFIGATVGTCAAVQILAAQGVKCMVAEKYIWTAHEYAVAYRTDGKEYTYTPLSPETAALKAEISERNIIAENSGTHLPALAPVFANRLKSSGVDCLFHARITGISEDCGAFTVKAFTAGQTLEFTAGRIIDTTSEFQSGAFFDANTPEYTEKSINSLLLPPEGECQPPAIEGVEFLKGRFDDELFMKLKLPHDMELSRARKFAYDYWINRPPALKEYKLVFTAPVFDYSPAVKRSAASEKAVYLPSGYYGCFLESYDNFTAFALNGGV